MIVYIFRRLLLIIPTLIGILLINFVIIQFAPGGPIEQVIAEISGHGTGATARLTGGNSGEVAMKQDITSGKTAYSSASGLDPEFIKQLEKQFGFDKPPHERFLIMIKNYLTFNFGESYFKGRSVIDIIIEKMPVSISLGVFTILISYCVSIPLGIRKAVKDGTPFDLWSGTVIIIGYAIPSFLFAIMLITFFAGGSFVQWFPLRGLTSDNFADLSLFDKIFDYLWHLILPITAMVIGHFASTTFLVKNSFLDEISKQYVLTARSKGLTEKNILYGHIFRNAMLVVIAGFPAAFISMFFTGNLLIETVFSLDGLGLLGYESTLKRDYPVVFATLYIMTLIGLIAGLISDIIYMLIDPRIDFEKRTG
jgi:microcin C transport system permease protein